VRAGGPILGGLSYKPKAYADSCGDATSAEAKPMSRFFSITILFLLAGFANVAFASTITFGGAIIQSTQDGTGPAVNNPGLNNIQDLQSYLVTLMFTGSITAPGTYNLTGANLAFSDSTAAASEASFGSISLTITANGGFDDFSFLGCLTTG